MAEKGKKKVLARWGYTVREKTSFHGRKLHIQIVRYKDQGEEAFAGIKGTREDSSSLVPKVAGRGSLCQACWKGCDCVWREERVRIELRGGDVC